MFLTGEFFFPWKMPISAKLRVSSWCHAKNATRSSRLMVHADHKLLLGWTFWHMDFQHGDRVSPPPFWDPLEVMPLTCCFLFAVRVAPHYKRPEVQNQRTRGYNGRKRSQGSRAWEDPVRTSIGPCGAGGDASRWRLKGLMSVSLALGKSSTISELQAVSPNYILAELCVSVSSLSIRSKCFFFFFSSFPLV